MKTFFLLVILWGISQNINAQVDTIKKSTPDTTKSAQPTKEQIEQAKQEIQFERPFNFFSAAGASYMFGDQYSVVISPIDNTVQFQKNYHLITRFSLGLVWNPIPENGDSAMVTWIKKSKNKSMFKETYKAARKHFAVALLVNVFQLGYSSKDINTSSPIDVGFGIGWRNSNFLILGTIEFTPVRTPRSYFVNQFKDKNQAFIMAGSTEPVKSIDINDNSIFMDRVFPSIGVKIAYTFSKQLEK